ncbi:hypothetical protein D3C77_378410 [compost metagenome]
MGDDGDDKHPYPRRNHRLLGSANQCFGRRTRDLEIDQVQAERPEQQAEADQRARAPPPQTNGLSGIQPGNDQGEGRRRQHHPGTKAEQGIGQRHRHTADHQHWHRAQRGPQCTQGTPFERAHHARLKVQPGDALRHQQGTAHQQQQSAQRQAKQAHTAYGHHIGTHTGTTHARAAR